MDNNVTITKSEQLQLMEAKAAAEFAITPAGQMLKQFETMQRIGKMLSTADIIPDNYKNNLSNCAIAVDMAMHLGNGISPLTVMQNLVIVHGRPTWGAAFLISCINTCGRFSPLRYEEKVEGKTTGNPSIDNMTCTAIAVDKETGEELRGTTISIQMAINEGWYGKNGSKWKTMPQQMLRYRAAAFWQRAYAPEIGMGFHTTEEMTDATIIYDKAPAPKKALDDIAAEAAMLKTKKVVSEPTPSAEPAKATEPIDELPFGNPEPTPATNPKENKTLL